jgi:ankyrin repeat protein
MKRKRTLAAAVREATTFENVSKFLLDGEDVNQEITLHYLHFGRPALYASTLPRLCIEAGQDASLKLLLKNGCSTDNLIDYAVQLEQLDCLRLLLKNSKSSPLNLHSAVAITVRSRREDVLAQLISQDADLSCPVGGVTPLGYAAAADQREIVALLLKARAPTSNMGGSTTPLAEAIKRGHTAVAFLLLQHAADPNALREGERSPVEIANSLGNVPLVHLLIAAVADVGSKLAGEKLKSLLREYEGTYSTDDISKLAVPLKKIAKDLAAFGDHLANMRGQLATVDFDSSFISPLINLFNVIVASLMRITRDVENFAKDLRATRLRILSKQIHIMVHREGEEFKGEFDGDYFTYHDTLEQTLKYFCDDTIALNEQPINQTQLSFEKKRNRCRLKSINGFVTQFKQQILDLLPYYREFERIGNELYSRTVQQLTKQLQLARKTPKNAAYVTQLEIDVAFINWEWKHVSPLTATLCRSLRYSYS